MMNTDTGAPGNADDDIDVRPADEIGPRSEERTPPLPSTTGPTITRERRVQETVAIAALAPEDALAEYDRMHAAQINDPSLADERTEAGRTFQERKDALIMRGMGLALEENRPLLEVHGWRGREPGTAALSPAPRPVLPDGYEFDEVALRLGEAEMHAMGARPSLVMEITDALAEIAEQAELRGVGWSEADTKAALVNRHGREGAQRVADNAQFAYQTLLESEHPLLAQRVRELGEEWGDDPRVITLFGTLVYEALCEGPMTPAKEALLSRRGARLRSAEEAGRAAAAKRRREEEAEADEARAAAMTEVAATHRRWRRVEP